MSSWTRKAINSVCRRAIKTHARWNDISRLEGENRLFSDLDARVTRSGFMFKSINYNFASLIFSCFPNKLCHTHTLAYDRQVVERQTKIFEIQMRTRAKLLAEIRMCIIQARLSLLRHTQKQTWNRSSLPSFIFSRVSKWEHFGRWGKIIAINKKGFSVELGLRFDRFLESSGFPLAR